MISKEDWQTVYREMVDEGRQQFEPPTVEEVEKLFRGELSEDEAERVRGLLSYYPEIVRAMTTPFPEEADDVLTDAEVEAGLAGIRRQVEPAAAAQSIELPRRRIATPTLALAAGVTIALGIGGLAYWQSHRAPGTKLTRILYADGERGGSSNPRGPQIQPPIELNAETDYLLKPVFRPSHAYRQYRIELQDLNTPTPRSIWIGGDVERQADGSYPVELSTKNLSPGRYRLVLYGVDDLPVPIATYTIRLYAP